MATLEDLTNDLTDSAIKVLQQPEVPVADAVALSHVAIEAQAQLYYQQKNPVRKPKTTSPKAKTKKKA